MLQDARSRAKKVRRAVLAAQISGWSMAVFAGLSLLIAVFGDVLSLAMGAALALLAANELRGAARLRRFDETGARVLGINQLLLAGLLLLYAGWKIYSLATSSDAGGLISAPDPGNGREVNEMLEHIGSSLKPLAIAVYGVVGLVGAVVPALTAVYYFSRATIVRRFRDQTPAWVIEAVNAAQ